MLDRWKSWVHTLKREVYALYLAYNDPHVPWYARVFAGYVVAYAFSPIDLIPDFIPVIGYLDDLIVVPLGIALAVRMIPATVLTGCREESHRVMLAGKPVNRVAAAVIIIVWFMLAALVGLLTVSLIRR